MYVVFSTARIMFTYVDFVKEKDEDVLVEA